MPTLWREAVRESTRSAVLGAETETEGRWERMKRYTIAREDSDVDELLNQCVEQEEKGNSKYPGMSYERGIRAAIEWLLGWEEIHPLE